MKMISLLAVLISFSTAIHVLDKQLHEKNKPPYSLELGQLHKLTMNARL